MRTAYKGKTMILSILIPTYNRSLYLSKNLDYINFLVRNNNLLDDIENYSFQ